MKFNKFVEQRIKKMALIIEATSKKIIKKELRKMQKDLIKGALKNGTKI